MREETRIYAEKFVDHIPKLKSIVSRIAKNEGVVDDITQEACVRIIQKEHLWYKQPHQFSQWMNTVTRNITKDYLKKKKEKPLQGGETLLAQSETESFSEEQISWVLSQFETLPKRQRDILQMVYYEGMSMTQVAKELKVSHQAVSQHVKSALETLRKRAKGQSVFAILLPWYWDRHFLAKFSLASNLKFTVSVLAVTFTAGVVTVVATDTFQPDTRAGDDVVINMQSGVQADTYHEKFIITNKESDGFTDQGVDRDKFSAVLIWLQTLDAKRFEKMTIDDLKDIRSLDLSEKTITTEGFKHLTVLKTLKKLSLNDAKITNLGLKHVKALTSLKELELTQIKVTDLDLETISTFKSLITLKISASEVSETGLQSLKSLTSLKSLSLGSTRITGRVLQILSTATSLTSLDLSGANITDEDLDTLTSFTDLQKLNLGGTGITDKALEKLSLLVSLKELALEGTNITNDGLAKISPLSLTALNLSSTNITDYGLANLNPVNLIFLNLSSTDITDAGLMNLGPLTLLSDLNLMGTNVTDMGLVNLNMLTALKSLNLGHTQVSGEGLKNLKSLIKLKELLVVNTNVTDSGKEEFGKVLPECVVHISLAQ